MKVAIAPTTKIAILITHIISLSEAWTQKKMFHLNVYSIFIEKVQQIIYINYSYLLE